MRDGEGRAKRNADGETWKIQQPIAVTRKDIAGMVVCVNYLVLFRRDKLV